MTNAIPHTFLHENGIFPEASAGLFIGISTFNRFKNVQFAVDDAIDLAWLFVAELGLIRANNCVLALEGIPKKKQNLKRLAILRREGVEFSRPNQRALYRLAFKVGQRTTENGLFIVTISTHGVTRQGVELLATEESDVGRSRESMAEVSTITSNAMLARAKYKILVFDACRRIIGPSLANHKTSETGHQSNIRTPQSNFATFWASKPGSVTFECPRKKNGILTSFLLEGLRGAAPGDERGTITLGILANFAEARVLRWTWHHRRASKEGSQGIDVDMDETSRQLPLSFASDSQINGGNAIQAHPSRKTVDGPSPGPKLRHDGHKKYISNQLTSLNRDPQNAKLWYETGNAFLRHHSYRISVAAWQKARALEKIPAVVPPREIGINNFLNEEYTNATENLRDGIRQDPNDAALWSILGSSFSLSNDHLQAIECQLKALKIDRRDLHTARALGNEYRHLQDYEKAVKFHEMAIRLRPKDSESWRELGNDYQKLGNQEKSVDCYRQSLELDSSNSQSSYDMGVVYLEMKNYQRAIRHIHDAINLEPRFALAWHTLGQIHSHIDESDKAIDCYNRALELNPMDASAYRDLGIEYLRLRLLDDSIKNLHKALDLAQRDVAIWKLLGIAYGKSKLFSRALEFLHQATVLDPQDIDSQRLLGTSHVLLKQYEPAYRVAKAILSLNPKDSSALGGLGYLLMIAGDLPAAISALEQSSQLSPGKSKAWSLWAQLLYRNGNWPEALRKAQLALECNPTCPHIMLLNWALAELGEGISEPIDYYCILAAVEAEGDKLCEAEWLALNYRRDEALDQLEVSVREIPDNAVFARFRPAFHFLRRNPRFVAITEDIPGSAWRDFSEIEISNN